VRLFARGSCVPPNTLAAPSSATSPEASVRLLVVRYRSVVTVKHFSKPFAWHQLIVGFGNRAVWVGDPLGPANRSGNSKKNQLRFNHLWVATRVGSRGRCVARRVEES